MSFDEVDKLAVKQALVDHLVAGLRSLAGDAGVESVAGRLDTDEPLEADDLSHSDEAAELSGLLEGEVARARAALAQVDALDFGPAHVVRPGAIVGFDGDRYVVGVVSGSFVCEGVEYDGLAVDAPVYPRIEGLGSGETFVVGGREHRIDFLL